MAEDDPILDTDAIAELAGGIATESVRMYLKRSRIRVRDGLPLRPHDLPLPDLQVGRSPAWRTSTVHRWLAARPRGGRMTESRDHRTS